MKMRLMAAVVIAAGAAAVGLTRQEGKPVQPPVSPAKAPLPSVEGLAFLKGSWVGEMDGGRVEEMWSGPSGNNLVGAFRWLEPDGKPGMFEVLAITAEPDGVYLRMHHYSDKLEGKEAADKPITCKMRAANASRVEFACAGKDRLDSVSYEVKEGALVIEVTFKPSSGMEPLKFKLKKQ